MPAYGPGGQVHQLQTSKVVFLSAKTISKPGTAVPDALESEFEFTVLPLASSLEHDIGDAPQLAPISQEGTSLLHTEVERQFVRVNRDIACPGEPLLAYRGSDDGEVGFRNQPI